MIPNGMKLNCTKNNEDARKLVFKIVFGFYLGHFVKLRESGPIVGASVALANALNTLFDQTASVRSVDIVKRLVSYEQLKNLNEQNHQNRIFMLFHDWYVYSLVNFS